MSTLSEGRAVAADASTALRLAEVFSDFGPAWRRLVTSGRHETGISFARSRLLHVLACTGPMIMSRIRDELGITARSVTALVDGLEEEALVTRSPHPTDRRATVIDLTEQGRATVEDVHRSYAERGATAFECLDPDDQEELLRLMRRLVSCMGEHPGPSCR